MTRTIPAAPPAPPTFLELLRGDDIVRATPARPARSARDLLPRAASLLGDGRDAPERARRGSSRTAGILTGIAVVMTGLAVSSVALPARTSAERPAGVLTGATVALTQSDLVAKDSSTAPSRDASADPSAGHAEAASSQPVGALPDAFAASAPSRGRVGPAMHSATAGPSAGSHRPVGAPSGSASTATSASASASSPAAPASTPAPSASVPASAPAPSVSVSASVPVVSPSASPAASASVGTSGLPAVPGA